MTSIACRGSGPVRRLLWIALASGLANLGVALADDWPHYMGPNRDAVWRETGVVEKFPEGGLRYRWRVPIGSGYAGPAVAGGKVFVHDRQLAPGASNPGNPFERGGIPGKERVLG